MNREYSLGVKFTADENSLERIALGGSVKLAAFTDTAKYGEAGKRVIPAGTVVKRDADNTLIPAAGTESAGTAFLTASDVVEGPVERIAPLTSGLYAGGVFYEDRLPQPLTAGQKTALGPKFTFQKSQGALIVRQ